MWGEDYMAVKATTFTTATATTTEKIESFEAKQKGSPFVLLTGEEIRKCKFEA